MNINSNSLYITASNWKHPKCLQQMNGQTVIIPSMEFSTIKTANSLIHKTTWINLQKIMLSEKSQSQIITYYMIPLKCPIYRNGLQISGCQE